MSRVANIVTQISAIRVARGMSMEAAATAAGWSSYQQWQKYESGKRTPKVEALAEMAEAVGAVLLFGLHVKPVYRCQECEEVYEGDVASDSVAAPTKTCPNCAYDNEPVYPSP